MKFWHILAMKSDHMYENYVFDHPAILQNSLLSLHIKVSCEYNLPCLSVLPIQHKTSSSRSPLLVVSFDKITMSTGTYTYRVLEFTDSIRVLNLQPRANSREDEIRCTLQHVTLSAIEYDLTPHYTALSYVWGDVSDQRTILVDGFQFHVTTNLFRALKSIRHELTELPLWVDAVCINQTGLKERSQQVLMMGLIYSSARDTTIYIFRGKRQRQYLWFCYAYRV